MFTRLILFFVIISFSFVFGQDSKNPNSLYEELGNYVIKNYDNVFLDRPEAIRSVIKSSKDNLVYYGTFNGIIEYDGKNVNRIQIKGIVENEVGSEDVRNIIESSSGKIFVSGRSVLGFLQNNEFGSKQYNSLLDQIPDSIDNNRQQFIGTKEFNNKIYFTTPEKIFRWDGNKFDKIWKFSDYEGSIDSPGKLHFLFKVGDRLFIRQWGVGLLEYRNEDFQFVNGSEIYSNNRIEVMFNSDNQNISIFSSTNGAYKFNGKKIIKNKNKKLDKWLIESNVTYNSELSFFSDGSIPIISNDGILILNQQQEIINLIDESDGLLSSQITDLFIDANDDLFVTNLLTAAKINFDNSLTTFDRSEGIKGVVTKIKRLNDKIFFSTTEDIFSVESNSNALEDASILELGVDDYVRDFNLFNNAIVSANNFGLTEFNQGKIMNILSDRGVQLPIQSALSEELLIISHPSDGIVFLKRNNKGILKKISSYKPASDVGVSGFREIKPGVLFIESSDDEGSFIGSYNNKGKLNFERLLIPKNDSLFKSLKLPRTVFLNSDLEDYFMEPKLCVFESGVGLLAFDLTDGIIYRFTSDNKLLPLKKKIDEIFENGINNFNPYTIINGVDQFTTVNKKTRNNWFLTSNGLLEVKFSDSSYVIKEKYNYGKIDFTELKGSFYAETKNNIESIWLGSKDSKIIRWSPKLKRNSFNDIPKPLIKEIYTGADLHNFSIEDISYDISRNMKFNLAFPSYNKEENNQYRVFLEGQDEQWSGWSANSERSYTNLDLGSYNFLFQAKDTNGNESEILSYQFKIKPPFYRTYLAWILYIIIFIISIWLLIKYQAKKSLAKADNKRKAAELEEAKKMQQNMLPKVFPKSKFFEISAGLITSTEVGGDYYDFFESENGDVFAVCGDATGHGTTSGMMVSIIKSALNSLPVLPVNKILEELNNIVKKIDLKRIKMSLVISKISKDKLTLSSAAMPPVYFYNASTKECEEILIQGIPLGGLRNEKYDLLNMKFKKDDVLIMLSDGLPEAVNKNNEMYDYERIREFILKNISKSADEIKTLLLQELDNWMDGIIPDDDVTFVVVKRK